jgi:hypothetical protein
MDAQVAFRAEFLDDELAQPRLNGPVDVARVVAGLIVAEIVELESEAARANGARAL